MMRLVFCIVLLFLGVQTYGQFQNDPVLLTIDNDSITRSEFEAIFRKNNRDSVITKADLDEYAELFINFKLKVKEAESLGMDTISQFARELKGYRDQLAKPYLADKSMTDSLVKQAYDRLKYEIRASHILITLPADPTPEDTLKAFNKITQLKKDLLKDPSKFAKVARASSQDPSAAANNGDLGYFTALQMVYPFENIVYETPVGQIGGPIRTQYGYHIVNITDKRDARGQVRVAHIMIRSEEGDPEDVKQRMEQRADDIYKRLMAGEDYATLAKKFSDDRSSSARSGELAPFGPGKMVSEFEEAAFALSAPGEISKPVKSPYGWHIIKLLEQIPLQSYEDMSKELEARITKDGRSNVSRESFINQRKKEYNFQEDRRQLNIFYADIDTSYFSGRWQPSAKLLKSNKTLFTLAGNEYSQHDFMEFLQQRMRARRQVEQIKAMVDDTYDRWVEIAVMDYEDSQLENKYPDFKVLINEYRDGILLFDLTDKKVWTKAVTDSAGLAEFYQNNRNEFMWQERAAFDIYTVENEKQGKAVIKMLKKGKNQDEIREKLSSSKALEVKVESGLKERADVPVLANVKWEKGISNVVNDNGQLKVVYIKEIRPSEPKDFDEARGIITASYQNALEAAWVKELRAQHQINLNKEVLYTIK